jgi:FO synthase subunit 2
MPRPKPTPSTFGQALSAENANKIKVLNTSSILDAVTDGRMLSPVEALHLLKISKDEDLASLRQAADEVRQRQVGDAVFYASASSLYLTNYCELAPALYDYPRLPGDPNGFVLSIDGIDAILERSVAQKIQQLYVSGGGYWSPLVIPGLEEPTVIKTYARVMSHIREHAPGLELTGFSPDEVEFLCIVSNRDEHYVLEMLKDLGLRVLGGNGVDVLVDSVRQAISPKKATVKRWLEIVTAAKAQGLLVQARLEAGPVETLQQRVAHLSIPTFCGIIPQMWTRLPSALMSPDSVKPQVSPEDRLKLTAVLRLFLGEALPDQQVFWQANGACEAQDALLWGANGLGSTNVLADLAFLSGSSAIQPVQEFSESDFQRLIQETGRKPVLRADRSATSL